MADKLTEKLLAMKQQLEEDSAKKERLKGGLEQDFVTLEKEFNVTTTKEGDKLLDELTEQNKKITNDIEEKQEQLEKMYDWQ